MLRNLGLSDFLLKSSALALRGKISYGLYQNLYMSDSCWSKVNVIYNNVIRSYSGGSIFVPNEELWKACGVSSLDTFMHYLLLTRHYSKSRFKIFEESKWHDATWSILPRSPLAISNYRQNPYSLRSSTTKATLESLNREKDRLQEKIPRQFQFVLGISEENRLKAIDFRKKNKWLPGQIKNFWKKELRLSYRTDLYYRAILFRNYKISGLTKANIAIDEDRL